MLAKTAGILALSLDQAETARQVARIVAESVGDVCIVDLVAADGGIQRTAATSGDPQTRRLVAQLTREDPNGDVYLTRAAVEQGQCHLFTNVGDIDLRSLVEDGADLELLRALAPGSILTVPLIARGHMRGGLAVIRGPRRIPLDGDDARLVDHLAQRAALALDNASLYETATSAVHLRDEVLGVVAHDLRNPLSGIMLVADVLSGSTDLTRTRSGVATIRRAGERMDRLIQDLLDVTKLEAGALRLERVPLPIMPVLTEALDLLRPLADAKSVSIGATGDGALSTVLADRARLLQVLTNIGGNAVKFTPHGGRIDMRAAAVEGRVHVSVSDTGPGIVSDEIEHVFDRFWQGRTQQRYGAGLGLAIAKGIVEAHGGRIWVESTAGSGSTFTFTLPLLGRSAADVSDRSDEAVPIEMWAPPPAPREPAPA